ncbi:hypothetical protein MMC07_009349 [Pseudocyphellaria aurata]|nr:hypothetical protein [Pseudocyphellaria aurata]
MPNLLASAHCYLSRAMRRILMGLGVLDWRPTACSRRDFGRQVAPSLGGSPAADPTLARAGVLRPPASRRRSTVNCRGQTQIDPPRWNCASANALGDRRGRLDRGGERAIELTTHPSDTTALHPSPTTFAAHRSGLDTTSTIARGELLKTLKIINHSDRPPVAGGGNIGVSESRIPGSLQSIFYRPHRDINRFAGLQHRA